MLTEQLDAYTKHRDLRCAREILTACEVLKTPHFDETLRQHAKKIQQQVIASELRACKRTPEHQKDSYVGRQRFPVGQLATHMLARHTVNQANRSTPPPRRPLTPSPLRESYVVAAKDMAER